ncbi:hypothetical protein AX16_006442 [Volvariella volvacea WC 439]|nr:hypothetical protein AX16_006442 [Volvariella volvacea WC 439]
MDPSHFKRLTTSRGTQYHYYCSPPKQDKPCLLLLHGFPSFAIDWRYQVAYFKGLGYGLVVPDMLGYGGTDKPTTPASYASSLICRDLIDILDAEGAHRVIAIGHDWGAKVVSRLANRFHGRFHGFAFLALGYTPPQPAVKYEDRLAMAQKTFGRDVIGYWSFFSGDGTPELIKQNLDSFISLLLADDKALWIDHLCPSGAFKVWIEANRRTACGSLLSEKELAEYKTMLKNNGLAAPTCWYKIMTEGIEAKDDESIPVNNYAIARPVFFGGAKQDYVALSPLGKATTERFCSNATIREFDAGHWLLWEVKDELNKELQSWIDSISSPTA